MKGQKTFFGEENRLEALSREGDPLVKLQSFVNWEIFRTILSNAFKKEPKGPGGRPPFDYVMMFKVLLLQRIYNLSDEQMQFQIMDRLSFMRFLNITLDDNIPDAKTIWHYREVLTQKNKIKPLFSKFNKELEKQKIMISEGNIVDASFVEVPVQRNTKDENDQIKGGGKPVWEENKSRQKDIDARWMKKHSKNHYGYKDHIKAGVKTKLIYNYCVSSASKHDSQMLEELIQDKDAHHELYADSAYTGKKIKELLNGKKIRNRIHKKAYRNRPLTQSQKEMNRKKSKTRARVEHVFGFMKNSMKADYLRCIGMQRVEACIGLNNLVYNIFRTMQLQQV